MGMGVGAGLEGAAKILKMVGLFLLGFFLRKGAVDAHKKKEAVKHGEIRDQQLENAHDTPRDRDELSDSVRDEGW